MRQIVVEHRGRRHPAIGQAVLAERLLSQALTPEAIPLGGVATLAGAASMFVSLGLWRGAGQLAVWCGRRCLPGAFAM